MGFFDNVLRKELVFSAPVVKIEEPIQENLPLLYIHECNKRLLTTPIDKRSFGDNTVTVHNLSDYRKTIYHLTLVPNVESQLDLLVTRGDKRCTLTL